MRQLRWYSGGASGLALALLVGCASAEPGGSGETTVEGAVARDTVVAQLLAREVARIDSAAYAIDTIFQPLPLLRPAEEESLRRFGNAQQLARASALGVERNLPRERLLALQRDSVLVPLEDSEYWVVRNLDYSQPLVVPGVLVLLREVGERFQERLASLGAPPYRFEITSALRTLDDQEALRRINPNAASGASAHQHGTTVDVLYSAYSAPVTPIVPIDATGAEWSASYLERYAVTAAERVAGRRSYELKAILGKVLIELQNEGRVMVTMERLQPVYHMTLAE